MVNNVSILPVEQSTKFTFKIDNFFGRMEFNLTSHLVFKNLILGKRVLKNFKH